MQRGGGGRDDFFGFGGAPFGFGGIGGFGRPGSLMSSFFGGTDPFDDPFFTRPFESMMGHGLFGPGGSIFGATSHATHGGFLERENFPTNRPGGPIIKELTSDDEEEEEEQKANLEKNLNPRKHLRPDKDPYVEEPEDDVKGRKNKQLYSINEFNRANAKRQHNGSYFFQSSTVSCGGPGGTYYTSSTTRRAGGDGVVMEESKEADFAARKASHRLSRGIHGKGHSVTRKLNSDGRVNTVQTLHNLNEDELENFEEDWNGKARQYLPEWSSTLSNEKMRFSSAFKMVRSSQKDKSSSTLRKDPAWKHSTQVDIGGDKTYVYLKCNYCDKIVKGGVTRIKEHLSCSHKNVAPCEKVPDVVRKEIREFMNRTSSAKNLSKQQFEDRIDPGSFFASEHSGRDSTPTFPPSSSRGLRGPMDHYMVQPAVDTSRGLEADTSRMIPTEQAKEARRRVSMDIGRFFYENAIPFNVATSPAYFNMVRSIGAYGRGYKPPSMYDLRTWILKEELANTEKTVDEIKKTWNKTGVTIMSDGWSDMKSRSLINILVNNPYGTVFLKTIDASDQVKDSDFLFALLDGVIEEIGEHLVVQVVTDNASAYKAAGQKLMEKRKHMYWTPCAAHCIDLILEKLGDLPQHKHALNKAKMVSKFIYNHSWVLALMRKFSKNELLRPAPTRFATAYLTLESMLDARQPLQAMFTSAQWMGSTWSKKAEGKEVRKIIMNDRFWATVKYAIMSTRPLVQVLRLVDAEKKPAMGFLYNAMDEAKELIAQNLGGDESSYKEIWGIIDDRWELQLHRHLHAAGYYLNPQFQYADNSSTHPEIKLGLYHCMDRLIADVAERGTADVQLIAFRNKEGFFGLQQAKDTITKRSPVEWWIQFGDGTPELQRFAIKVLGLTCSSSACERNWSTYNQIHTKRRNRLSTLRMNSLAYIMYNKKLKDRSLKKKAMNDGEDPLLCEDIPSDDEWFIDDENDVTTPEFHQEDLNVDFFTTERQRPTTSSDPKQKGKRKNIEIEEEEEDWEALESFEPEDEGIEAGQTHIDTDEDPLNFDDLL